jgi:hypothetical protein
MFLQVRHRSENGGKDTLIRRYLLIALAAVLFIHIGYLYFKVTPIELAYAYSTIASGGIRFGVPIHRKLLSVSLSDPLAGMDLQNRP